MRKLKFLIVIVGCLGLVFPTFADGLIISKPTELVEEEPEEIREDPFASALDNLELEVPDEYKCPESEGEKTSVVRTGEIRSFIFPHVEGAPITSGKSIVCSR